MGTFGFNKFFSKSDSSSNFVSNRRGQEEEIKEKVLFLL